MTAWFYLVVFILLNVFLYLGMQRINRHLSAIGRQLETAVQLLAQLNDRAAMAREHDRAETKLEREPR